MYHVDSFTRSDKLERMVTAAIGDFLTRECEDDELTGKSTEVYPRIGERCYITVDTEDGYGIDIDIRATRLFHPPKEA